MQENKKLPSVWLSFLPLLILIGLLVLVLSVFGTDALSGASQIALLVTSACCILLGLCAKTMKWEDFDKYCTWLFSLLSLVEQRTNIAHYSPTQIRIYGYMGEYLLNVWVRAMNKRRIYKPVLWFNDTGDFWGGSLVKYKLRCLFNDVAVWFAKDRSRIFRLKK